MQNKKTTKKTRAAKSQSLQISELRQEVAFLNSIIDSIPHMIFLKAAKDLRFVRLNKAGQNLLGYKEKDLLGKNDYDLFPKQEANFFTKKDREVLKTKHVMNISEEPIQTRLKGSRTLHTQKCALYDLKGKPAYLLGISEDITEQKESASRLIESEKQLHLALKVAGIGVWSWQVEEDSLFWDKNMFQIYGVPPSAGGIVNYAVFSNCLHPRNRDRVNQAVQNALKNSNEYNDTFVIVHPDKGEREIAVRCTIDRDKHGAPISMTGSNFDVTELQQKRAVEVKSKMISMVSHELRTPLHTIKESINVVLEELTGAINADQRDILSTAQLCINRLTRLINNVLDFQKMDAGMSILTCTQTDLYQLIKEITEVESANAQKKNLSINLDLGHGKLLAEIDTDKIIQVLTNLIHNAIKFTTKGSITITARKEKSFAKISVRDTGVGFSHSDAQTIFSEFGQTESSRKYFPEGTGLGLAISKKIVLGHGGKIWAESKKPLGSIFHILLPLNQKNESHV